MKIVLTGSAGFIGSAIRRQLDGSDHEVVCIDFAPGAPEGTHRRDVREAADWIELLAGADVVCHQAAKVGAGVSVADLAEYASHNDLGTAALLAAMRVAGVDRLVLASSMVVYGEGRYVCAVHGVRLPPPRDVRTLDRGEFENHCAECGSALSWEKVPEDAPLDPRGAYAVSKLAQEGFASGWARQAPGAVIALRYHNVYGPWMPRDTPYSGVAAMFRSSIERGEPPTVYEDGGQMRDFIHVDDIARANIAAIEAIGDVPAGHFAAYNVCSGQPISIGEVANIIGGAAEPQRPPVITGGYRASDVRHIVADPARIAHDLGFRATIAPHDGLRAFVHDPLRD